MKSVQKSLLALVLLALFRISWAHQGHDHGHHEDESPGNWTFTAELKKKVGVNFKWMALDEEFVAMEMSTKTRGYVSVGFCNVWKGSMEGCDIVVGWVDDKDGKAHLVDYHSHSNDHPMKDKSQDYELISGNQEEWLTTIQFKRKWNTGDAEDANLSDGNQVQLIWSWHPSDPSANGTLSAHDRNTRGHTTTMISMRSPPPENNLALQAQDHDNHSTGSSSSSSVGTCVLLAALAVWVLQDL